MSSGKFKPLTLHPPPLPLSLKPIIKIRKLLPVDSGVFPAVAVVADVPQADRRVGDDRDDALAGAVVEGVVLGKIP